LSAKIEREDLRQGMDLGASDYITKPFKIAELVNSIQIRLNQVKNLKTDVDTKIINSISDFIHITKHECNTPLHGIITLSELLATDPVVTGSDFLDKALQSINMSGKRLLKTLNNLIDLVRLRHYTEPLTARNEEINITDLLKNVIDECKREFPDVKNIKTNLDNISSDLLLLEDIQIVFFELINNAFKFSKADTPIEVSLQNSFKNGVPVIQFNVSNTATEPLILKEKDIGPFKQNNRADLEQQGSGLGLYISLLVTEKYMGSLTINSSIPEIFSIQISFPINKH
jgi:signal transduction histidine kinase